jgi:hypothetical protein
LADVTGENRRSDDNNNVDGGIADQRSGLSIDRDGLSARKRKASRGMLPTDSPERHPRKILKEMPRISNAMSTDPDQAHADRMLPHRRSLHDGRTLKRNITSVNGVR